MNRYSDSPTPVMPPARGRPDGAVLAAISNELVKLHARCYGRGPTKARTLMVEDVVICSLREPFTRAERTLLDLGRRDEVTAMRAAFQHELRHEFAEVIERLTGRRVSASVADIHVDPDMAVQVFFLEPAPALSDGGGDCGAAFDGAGDGGRPGADDSAPRGARP